MDGFLHLPLVLPPVVTGYLLLILFGKKGFLGAFLFQVFGLSFSFNFKGAVLASMVVSFPLFYNSIRVAMEGVDFKLEEAGRTLGHSPLSVFFKITLPLSRHGVIIGALLCFARSLSEFGATITFVSNIAGETMTLPLAIYSLVQSPGGDHRALLLVLVSVGISFSALLISEFLKNKIRALV